jgi:hypothetical protein
MIRSTGWWCAIRAEPRMRAQNLILMLDRRVEAVR